ncbi:cyclomaltodextrinase N-terminal domain-containing protein [Shewanella oneidensis]|uniref:cyclomaltodextrinase N-terminal domain-containing protein n=1 Tax=Shewanella oneidensis TaxID=70863 RepID=UPI0002E77723|nr:hypothetical protein [Shewanella oneidensis]
MIRYRLLFVLVLSACCLKYSTALAVDNSVTNTESIHIEPLSWWAGMHNPKLQLMLHSNTRLTVNTGLKVEIAGLNVHFVGIEHTRAC